MICRFSNLWWRFYCIKNLLTNCNKEHKYQNKVLTVYAIATSLCCQQTNIKPHMHNVDTWVDTINGKYILARTLWCIEYSMGWIELDLGWWDICKYRVNFSSLCSGQHAVEILQIAIMFALKQNGISCIIHKLDTLCTSTRSLTEISISYETNLYFIICLQSLP